MQQPVPMGCLVAYIDILGFKSFSTAFGKFPKAHGMMKCFCNAIDKLCLMPGFKTIRAYQGSDCVFVKNDVPDRIIRFVKLLYQHCVYRGVLLRGALSGGNFIDLRKMDDPFQPKSQAEFLPFWGDASTLAAKAEGVLKGSRFFIDGDIQLDGKTPLALRKAHHPDIVEVRGLLSPEFTAKVPHLHELLWHRLIPAKDVQQFEETIGGPAIPTLDEITQKLKQMSAQYRKSADKEGLEQVQQTYLLVCEV